MIYKTDLFVVRLLSIHGGGHIDSIELPKVMAEMYLDCRRYEGIGPYEILGDGELVQVEWADPPKTHG